MYKNHIIYILLLILLNICTINAQLPYHRYQIIGSLGYSNPFHVNKINHHFKGAGVSGSAGVQLFFNQYSGLALSIGREYHSSASRFNDFLQDKYLVNNLATSRPGWTNISFLGGPVFKLRKQKFEIDAFGQVGIHVIKVPYLDFRLLMNGEMYEIARLSGGVEQLRLAWQSGINVHYRMNENTSVIFRSAVQSNLGLSHYNQLFSYRDVSDVNRNNQIDIGEYIAAPLIDEASLNNFLHLNISLGVSYAFGLRSPQSEYSGDSEDHRIYSLYEMPNVQNDSLNYLPEVNKPGQNPIPQKQALSDTIKAYKINPAPTNDHSLIDNHIIPDDATLKNREQNKTRVSDTDNHSKTVPAFKDTTAVVRVQFITNNAQNAVQRTSVYKIQIAALSTNQKNISIPGMNIPVEIEYHTDVKLYKYMAGRFSTENEALIKLMEIRALGFSDAFIAIYQEDKRISTSNHK